VSNLDHGSPCRKHIQHFLRHPRGWRTSCQPQRQVASPCNIHHGRNNHSDMRCAHKQCLRNFRNSCTRQSYDYTYPCSSTLSPDVPRWLLSPQRPRQVPCSHKAVKYGNKRQNLFRNSAAGDEAIRKLHNQHIELTWGMCVRSNRSQSKQVHRSDDGNKRIYRSQSMNHALNSRSDNSRARHDKERTRRLPRWMRSEAYYTGSVGCSPEMFSQE